MDINTQPTLCCLGETASGLHVQFVVERGLASLDLDWRVFTVEVDSEHLPEAIAGILAMRLSAIRLFQSHQTKAIHLLPDVPEILRWIGSVTSARREDDRLIAWHNLGHGILDEVSRHCLWSQTVCWLHGDSLRTRSLWAAMSNNLPMAVTWTEAPDDVALATEDAERVCIRDKDASQDALDSLSERLTQPSETLVCVTDQTSSQTLNQDWYSAPRVRTLLASDDAGPHQTPDSSTIILTEADQIASGDAYDFQRWTGQSIDVSVLRDAYDEYSDFF